MPRGDDDETVARCNALLFPGELLADELFFGKFLFGKAFFNKVLAGAFLVREFLASRVFLECRTFIRLKWSTIVDGTRAEPVSIRRSGVMHMGFTVRTHVSWGVDPLDITVLSPGFEGGTAINRDCGTQRDPQPRCGIIVARSRTSSPRGSNRSDNAPAGVLPPRHGPRA